MLLSVPLMLPVSVSIKGAESAVTSTCWLTFPTSSVIFTPCVCSPCSVTFSRTCFLKPVISASILYWPGGRLRKLYTPAESLVLWVVLPVSLFVKVTVAPEIVFPCASRTTPWMPARYCAWTIGSETRREKRNRAKRRTNFEVIHHPYLA